MRDRLSAIDRRIGDAVDRVVGDLRLRKTKEPHSQLLENLFTAYAEQRLEALRCGYGAQGSISFDQHLLTFLNAVLAVIRLGEISDDELIGEEDARGIWQRWWCTNQSRFLPPK